MLFSKILSTLILVALLYLPGKLLWFGATEFYFWGQYDCYIAYLEKIEDAKQNIISNQETERSIPRYPRTLRTVILFGTNGLIMIGFGMVLAMIIGGIIKTWTSKPPKTELAQQGDSAEASTIAVPPSKPSGSPR